MNPILRRYAVPLLCVAVLVLAVSISGCTSQIPASNNQLNTTTSVSASASVMPTPIPSVTPSPSATPAGIKTTTQITLSAPLPEGYLIQGQEARTTATIIALGPPLGDASYYFLNGVQLALYVDGAYAATAVTNSNGQAVFSYGTASLPLGNVTYYVTYAGNSTYAASTSATQSYALDKLAPEPSPNPTPTPTPVPTPTPTPTPTLSPTLTPTLRIIR